MATTDIDPSEAAARLCTELVDLFRDSAPSLNLVEIDDDGLVIRSLELTEDRHPIVELAVLRADRVMAHGLVLVVGGKASPVDSPDDRRSVRTVIAHVLDRWESLLEVDGEDERRPTSRPEGDIPTLIEMVCNETRVG